MSGVQAWFDRFAEQYDASTAGDWTVNEQLRDVLTRTRHQPRSVLDLGSGTGQTSVICATLFPEASLDLVELSGEMASLSRSLLPQASVHVGDLDEFLRSDARTYDLVVLMGVLELLPDQTGTARRACARLAPGGRIVLTHEPLIAGEPVQGSPETSIPLPTGPMTVRRVDPIHVVRGLSDAGVTIDVSRLFVAYHREEAKPVVCHLVSGTRASPSRDLAG